jgi:hypothetical protein
MRNSIGHGHKYVNSLGGVIGTGLFLGSGVSQFCCSPYVSTNQVVIDSIACRRACRCIDWLRHCRQRSVLSLRFHWRDDRVLVSQLLSSVSLSLLLLYSPNVGGVVGLADLYVDKALGFSLGWAAWVCTVITPLDPC